MPPRLALADKKLNFSCAYAWLVIFACTFAIPPKGYTLPSTLCAHVAELLPLAEKLRQLRAIRPVRCREVSQSEYLTLTDRLTRAQNEPARLHAEETLFKALGFIPENYAYAECTLHGFGNSSWALYDRIAKEIVLRNDLATSDSILIHELVHALQDQHFDLTRLRRLVHTSDEDLALSALVEGDAMVVEREADKASTVASPVNSDDGFSEKCRPPPRLFDLYMFPYEWGLRFAGELTRDERNLAFRAPPLTTRAILYPLEFKHALHSEAPLGAKTLIDLRSPLYRDTLGEYFIRSLFKLWVDPPAAILAGKGWLQDNLQLRSNDETVAIKWRIQVEGPPDVAQLCRAFKGFEQGLHGFMIESSGCTWRAEKRALLDSRLSSDSNSVQYTVRISRKTSGLPTNYSGPQKKFLEFLKK